MFVSLVAPGAVESSIWEKAKTYKQKLRSSTSLDLKEVYKTFIKAGDEIVNSIKPIPAIEVAKVVDHALTAKYPKYEYRVGSDARKAYIFSKFPKRFLNKLIIKHMKDFADK